MTDELLRCPVPWCNGEAVDMSDNADGTNAVLCTVCGVTANNREQWNNRHTEWYPISSIPDELKDWDKQVDLWEVGERFTNCNWSADSKSWFYIEHGESITVLNPTHYMTPPAPPAPQQHEIQTQGDEYFCPKCAKRWSTDEETPECET